MRRGSALERSNSKFKLFVDKGLNKFRDIHLGARGEMYNLDLFKRYVCMCKCGVCTHVVYA